MQVDLSSLATPVEVKKRTYKKRKVEPVVEEEVLERPTTSGKSLPVKEKKPPTEKQLAAREKMKQARLEKIAKVKAEKEALDEEIRKKAEEIEKKKAELAERRRLKREEKKKSEPQKPVLTSDPGKSGDVAPPQPTIAESLASISKPKTNVEEEEEEEEEEVKAEDALTPPVEVVENPNLINLVTPKKKVSIEVPDAPKREYTQRFRTYPFGKAIPAAPRFR